MEGNASDPEGTSGPRSIALIGPQGSGKSVLFEALLAAAGANGKRQTDTRKKAIGTDLHIGHCSFMGDDWAILDCPGSIEFAHEACCALAVVDLAVLVCDPVPEKALAAAPLLRWLRDEDVPHLVFINKIDSLPGLAADIRETVAALQVWSPQTLALRQMPIHEGDSIIGYTDLVNRRAYRYREGQAELIAKQALPEESEEARAALLEALADHDDALLEKVVEDIPPSDEEIYHSLPADVEEGTVIPVLIGAGLHGRGVFRLWKALRHDTPAPDHTAARRGLAPDGEALAQVCKTVHAGHAGRHSYARVWRGVVTDGATVNGHRISGVYRFDRGEPVKVAEATSGDIVALGRLEGVTTGATLSPSGTAKTLPWPTSPPPVYALAITTEGTKEDVKLSSALQKLADEDPCVHVVHDAETGEIVLRGQGDIHINAAIERLATISGLKVSTARPLLHFRETITRAVQQAARVKRQTGGHGQFADVTIEIKPRARGEGFVFTDRIVGGVVPKHYIPAVGEAAEAATAKGPFGHPVVDIEVVLVDGGFHAVDSSDMAFKNATRQAMQAGLAKAEPVMLEPIDHVTISVPADYTSSAQRLLTGRRGRILGYAERPGWPGWDDVEAHVPAAELQDLITELRSLTMGLGTYRHAFDHLAEARGNEAGRAAAQ